VNFFPPKFFLVQKIPENILAGKKLTEQKNFFAEQKRLVQTLFTANPQNSLRSFKISFILLCFFIQVSYSEIAGEYFNISKLFKINFFGMDSDRNTDLFEKVFSGKIYN
jgi:hypothetical protein